MLKRNNNRNIHLYIYIIQISIYIYIYILYMPNVGATTIFSQAAVAHDDASVQISTALKRSKASISEGECTIRLSLRALSLVRSASVTLTDPF